MTEQELHQRLEHLEGVAKGNVIAGLGQINKDKALIKEAISEWLDTKFALFGKWTASGLMVSAFASIAYYAFTHGLWIRK